MPSLARESHTRQLCLMQSIRCIEDNHQSRPFLRLNMVMTNIMFLVLHIRGELVGAATQEVVVYQLFVIGALDCVRFQYV
jgi:hypothetical protein